MNTIDQFNYFSFSCSKIVAQRYSTSFHSAIQLLSPDIRQPIYSIYGLVRLADEIVDTFHDFDKALLLKNFREDTFTALSTGISLNPILQSFQQVVNRYNIAPDLINAFFNSMAQDLTKNEYLNEAEFKGYIYGSAEVVGLMCLQVFCNGDQHQFESLKEYAKALGSAFQKVNFLRDLQSDVKELKRSYFPGFESELFNSRFKERIEADIKDDFKIAYEGIKQLPLNSRFGVYLAYRYYLALFEKMRKTQSDLILRKRIRIPDHIKMVIFLKARLRNQFNLI